MHLRMDEEQKQLIEEISAISGLQKEVIREVWEFSAIRWAEQILSDTSKMHRLVVPYLGTVGVKYINDTVEPTGAVSTNVEAFAALSPQFKKMVGDLVDEGPNVIESLLERKISSAILTLSSSED